MVVVLTDILEVLTLLPLDGEDIGLCFRGAYCLLMEALTCVSEELIAY
jgi:hypothetical protein